MDRRGRLLGVAGITEVAITDFRGSRGGMYLKIDCPVLEIRSGRRGGHRPSCIRQRKHDGPVRKSEGFIVPSEAEGQHNRGRGKEPCFVRATEGRRIRGLPKC